MSIHSTSSIPVPRSLIKLHSEDHETILNVIDRLRSEGISKYVSLPQLIVCGDQSSGKSSVLEAISGLDFPRKENLCTRFATELILRRASHAAVAVSIYPDDSRPESEKQRIRSWSSPSADVASFGKIVKSAEDFLGLDRDGQRFFKDVLRVELQGPEQSPLTLVDLPGLYHAPDESQDEQGVEFVEDLVSSYMHNKRSVILAVVSAKSDIALQKVTAFTRKVDRHGTRTMGIVTKPDTLPKGSDMERSFFELASNKRMPFSLGWHVLKNRDYEERNMTLDQRAASETRFLSSGIWARLPRRHVGIDLLRPRLSGVLRDHILSQLPGFIEETRNTLTKAKQSLQRLGEPRQDLIEQRRYLLRSSERFTSLINSAVRGVYSDSYFGDAMTDEGYEKRLRAVIQNRLSDFSISMKEHGEHRKIIDNDDGDGDNTDSEGLGGNQVHRSDFVDEVRRRMQRSRGCELPGTFNPLIIGDLFYIQSKPWSKLTTNCIDLLVSDLRRAILHIMREVLDEKSFEGLLGHVINPEFDNLEESLRSKTAELLKPQQFGHPITYNHYFIDCIQKAREAHRLQATKKKLQDFFAPREPHTDSDTLTRQFNLDRLAKSLVVQSEVDMEKFACSEAIDCMVAYYEVAREKFVDDFSNLAVEKCFLESLPSIFSSRTVDVLDDAVVEEIAAEDESSKTERRYLQGKVAMLETSLQELHRLDQHKLAGKQDRRPFSTKEPEAEISVAGSLAPSEVTDTKYMETEIEVPEEPPSPPQEPRMVFEFAAPSTFTERLDAEPVERSADGWESGGTIKSKKKSTRKSESRRRLVEVVNA